MFYIKIGENRLFLISEYWILIPLMLWIDYILIRKIKNKREKKKRKKNYKAKWKQLKIFCLANQNMIHLIRIRGGEEILYGAYPQDLVQEDHPKCDIGLGLRYVDNPKLRELVIQLAKAKKRTLWYDLKRVFISPKVIFITREALCHIIKRHGAELMTPGPLLLAVGLTSWYQAIRKVGYVAILGAGLGGLFAMINPILRTSSMALIVLAVKLMVQNPEYIAIETTLIDASVKAISPRIQNQVEVISVNLGTQSINNMEMERMVKNQLSKDQLKKYPECLLQEHNQFNPNCQLHLKPSQILEVLGLNYDIKNIEGLENELVYDNIINMNDISGVDKVDFSDRLQVPPSTEVTIKSKTKAKSVNFLDKFGDPKEISESETWNTDENALEVISQKNDGESTK